MKAAIQKAQLEAEEELKRISETSLRREKEQEEVINKLQVQEHIDYFLSLDILYVCLWEMKYLFFACFRNRKEKHAY